MSDELFEIGDLDEIPDDGWEAEDDETLRQPFRRRLVAAVVLVAFIAWFFAGTLAILFPEPVREAQRLGQRTTFDPKAWREERTGRYLMAADLERTGRLNGLTGQELESLLGPPDSGTASGASAGRVVFEYRLGSTLVPWPAADVLLVSLLPDGTRVAGTRIGVPQRFTQRDWTLFPGFRAEMARRLVDGGGLNGLDRAGVLALLGPSELPATREAPDGVAYALGGDKVLAIGFGADGRVSEQGVFTRD